MMKLHLLIILLLKKQGILILCSFYNANDLFLLKYNKKTELLNTATK